MALVIKELHELEKIFSEEGGCFFSYQFDSREIRKGDIFIAIKGEKVDGHDFLCSVAEKGAKGAIVDKRYMGSNYGMTLYGVDDVVEAMQYLAKIALQKKARKIVSVTGSVGKTTTKEFINTMLQEKFVVSRNLKSFNSQCALPLSILNMKDTQDIILLEMGMSERGEMGRLADIVQPDIAVFTPIGPVHIGNFNGVEEIVKEKTKVLNTERTKLAIVPFDLLKYKSYFNSIQTVSYSLKNEKSDYFLYVEGEFIYIKGKNNAIFPKVFSEAHLLENFLATYVLAKQLGMENREIEKQLLLLTPPPMRFEKIVENGIVYIKDCYNANPISMVAALENLPSVKGKKIAVLGDMGDLGSHSQDLHEAVGREAAKHIDILFCYGAESKYIAKAFNGVVCQSEDKGKSLVFKDLTDVSRRLELIAKKGDLVLVKGSRFLCLENVLNFL